ncbi:MAG: 3-dehydroquinate synthase [Prevotellaceae bacterium]|jgi:3-dehydroquinate synthase|nr:3-dehydroquinate synthase [Prevotellaceae bacterium]
MTIALPDGRRSEIAIGGRIRDIGKYAGEKRVFILTNPEVFELYGDAFPAGAAVVLLPPGEKNKTLDTVSAAVSRLIEEGADRESLIAGVGGGIVCDMTGFIASIYMRGVRFGFVPTTLMAQVDASVGGKNGVNHEGYKNMIGVFNQPDFVLCDTETLRTLPERELKSGLAEVVKSALIADAALFEYLENRLGDILERSKEVLDFIVERSLRIKAKIVEADEREAGERRKLNLGHTLGHAIEKLSDNAFLHGEAVGAGLALAARLSNRLGLLADGELSRILRLLTAAGLPVAVPIEIALLLEAAEKDKKKQGDSLHFVLNKGIGDSIVKKMSCGELRALFGDAG